jgi:hypothetical protein
LWAPSGVPATPVAGFVISVQLPPSVRYSILNIAMLPCGSQRMVLLSPTCMSVDDGAPSATTVTWLIEPMISL